MKTLIGDWSLYRTLLTVAREGTLQRAAEQLGTSVSSVHRHLAELERALDTRLFERHGRRRVLTAAGERLVARLDEVEERLHGIERQIVGSDHAARGTVVVTTTDTIADGLLDRHLRVLRERCPEVRLDVSVDNRHFRLGRGEADLALRPGARPTELDVVARQVGEVAFSHYASREFVARHGRPHRRADLRGYDAVVVDESLAHTVYGRVAAERTDPERQVLRSPSLLVQATAVSRGVGIAALPCFLMDPRPEVVRLFQPEPESSLWLLYPAELRHVARVRAVLEVLIAGIAEDAALLAGKTR